jgi:hypothetical protein
MAESGRSQVSPPAEVPNYLRIVGIFVRSVFIVTLIAVTWSISIPQNITATAFAHYSAGDFIRAAIGIAICAGMIVQLVRLPKDDEGYKTWVYIGLGLAFVWAVFTILKLAMPDVI